MKSAEGTILQFAAKARRSDELAFLPAALEIMETPASPAGRAIAGSVMAFIVLAIAWASLSHIDIVATAAGRIIPAGSSKIVQPLENGVVRSIDVTEGQSVRAGDELIQLDATDVDADVRRLDRDLFQDRLDIARLRTLLNDDATAFRTLVPAKADDSRLIAEARGQLEAQAAEQAAKLASLDSQIDQKSSEVDESKATVEKDEAVVPILRDQRDIRKKVMDMEYGSRLQFLQAEQQYVEGERSLPIERKRFDEASEALTALQRQRGQIEADYRKQLLSDLAKARTLENEHDQERVKADQRLSLRTLRAPLDGTVQQLAIHTVGGVVTAAQQLMVIVPQNSDLEIEANLANKDVGFVQVGQEAEIKVEAFNFTTYGLLNGTVTNISHDAANAQGSAPGRSSPAPEPPQALSTDDSGVTQPSYLVRIAIKQNGVETEQGLRKLDPGMGVTTEIKTGRRRVIDYLLSPLLKYRNEAGRER